MWLLRQCMDEWELQGNHWSLPDLLSHCESLPAPAVLVDVDDPQLILPGNAIAKINAQVERLGQPRFGAGDAAIPALANTVLHSMAARYAAVLSSIAALTGKKLRRLFIVGGGNQNRLLNHLTAQHTGQEIILGSTESATIGNFAVQMAALERDGNSSGGVTAESVAKWAEQMSVHFLAMSNDREAS
jgi:rhamnulokinase